MSAAAPGSCTFLNLGARRLDHPEPSPGPHRAKGIMHTTYMNVGCRGAGASRARGPTTEVVDVGFQVFEGGEHVVSHRPPLRLPRHLAQVPQCGRQGQQAHFSRLLGTQLSCLGWEQGREQLAGGDCGVEPCWRVCRLHAISDLVPFRPSERRVAEQWSHPASLPVAHEHDFVSTNRQVNGLHGSEVRQDPGSPQHKGCLPQSEAGRTRHASCQWKTLERGKPCGWFFW